MNKLHVHFATAKALSTILFPFAEVVIHDLNTNSIAAIYNNFSKRNVGDESLLENIDDFNKLPEVFPLYSKINWNGRKMKSISATLRDLKGNAIGLMCINLDISKWEELHQFLGSWLHGLNEQPQPTVLFKDDWRERINIYVSEYLTKEGVDLKQLSKEKKRALILQLHAEGAFKAKNAAHYIADVLDLSRATIYNYLR